MEYIIRGILGYSSAFVKASSGLSEFVNVGLRPVTNAGSEASVKSSAEGHSELSSPAEIAQLGER